MGSKAKKRRHTASSGSETARTSSAQQPKAATPSPTYRPGFVPGKTTRNSDPVTGQMLRADTPSLILRDYDASRARSERKPIPTSINVLKPETVEGRRERDPHAMARNRRNGGQLGTYAGGLRFSPAFGEYIGPVTAAERERQTADWRVWWRNPYLVRGVRKRLGPEVTDALILLYGTDRDYLRVARHVGRPWEWLARHERTAWRVASEVARGDVSSNVTAVTVTVEATATVVA